MYQTDPTAETPPDDTIIWRYIDLERFLTLLGSSSLYICRLDSLDDQWEGLWPSFLWRVAGDQTDWHGHLRRYLFVNCWHESAYESAAFWDQYGKRGSVAIRSTVGRLKGCGCFDSFPGFFLIGRVRYIDYERQDLAPDVQLAPVFLKRRSFEHEREVRLVYWEGHERDGFDFPVDLAVLIETIFISPHSPPWLVAPVQEVLTRLGLTGVTVQRSELYDARRRSDGFSPPTAPQGEGK
jgi:hypothetical protein